MTEAAALALTIAIEVPAVVGLAALLGWARGERLPLLLVAVGANLLSHPLLWWADAALSGALRYGPRVALLEAAVVLFEGWAYAVPAGLGLRRGLLASAVANGTSLAAGLAIYGVL